MVIRMRMRSARATHPRATHIKALLSTLHCICPWSGVDSSVLLRCCREIVSQYIHGKIFSASCSYIAIVAAPLPTSFFSTGWIERLHLFQTVVHDSFPVMIISFYDSHAYNSGGMCCNPLSS